VIIERLVRVTQAHLDAGEPGKCSRCPVALAVAGAFPEAEYVLVDKTTIAMALNGLWTRTPTPPGAARRIGAIDRQIPAEPFEFTLRVSA
jgi:hypothetical protein